MDFREWLKLQEVGTGMTGTNAVAVFAQPIGWGEPFRRGNYEDLKLGGRKTKGRKIAPVANAESFN